MKRKPPRSTLFPYTTLFRSSSSPTTHRLRCCSHNMRTSSSCAWLVSWNSSTSTYCHCDASAPRRDRKSTRLNSSHGYISYAVFCLKKKKKKQNKSENKKRKN